MAQQTYRSRTNMIQGAGFGNINVDEMLTGLTNAHKLISTIGSALGTGFLATRPARPGRPAATAGIQRQVRRGRRPSNRNRGNAEAVL